MNGRRRKIILAAAIVLILGSGGSLLWDYWAQNRSEKIYEELAAETSSEPIVIEIENEPEEEPYVSPINFEAHSFSSSFFTKIFCRRKTILFKKDVYKRQS